MVAWGYEGVRIWAKRPGAKTLEGSKADLRRRMRARSEREEPPVLTRGLKVVGAKRRAASPPTAESDSKIWVEDSRRRPHTAGRVVSSRMVVEIAPDSPARRERSRL